MRLVLWLLGPVKRKTWLPGPSIDWMVLHKPSLHSIGKFRSPPVVRTMYRLPTGFDDPPTAVTFRIPGIFWRMLNSELTFEELENVRTTKLLGEPARNSVTWQPFNKQIRLRDPAPRFVCTSNWVPAALAGFAANSASKRVIAKRARFIFGGLISLSYSRQKLSTER